MIYVAPGAQKTDGYQANRNLVLSPKARADSIPGLEILADDVRCTHGATVGRLEQEPLFYLAEILSHFDLIAVQEVRDKVSSALRDLPPDIDPPQVSKVDLGAAPVLTLALSRMVARQNPANRKIPPLPSPPTGPYPPALYNTVRSFIP